MFAKLTDDIKVITIIFIIIVQRLKILVPLTFIYQVCLKWIKCLKRITFNLMIII